MSSVRGTTRVIAIFGDPVEHSLSPAMHNAAFEALGLDYVYVALRVRSADLGRALAGARAAGFAGLNVTVPHKEKIAALLDAVSPAARAIGAVNTVIRRGADLVGDNTDAEGFRRAVTKLGFRARGKSAILLGAGGSARAVAWSLADGGIRQLWILNRDLSRAEKLARRVRSAGGREVAALPLSYASRSEVIGEADLVVNCTSLGIDGRSVPPIAFAASPERCLFYDLVYGARPTPFVGGAKRHGRRASDGLGTLLEQGALAFRSWTGRRPPIGVMERALRR